MADLTPEVMHVLGRLVSDDEDADFSDLPTEQILEALRMVRQRKKIEGRAAAELFRRGMKWPEIARELGVENSTPQKWAREYRKDNSPDG